ncbi:MAG: response regulator [Cyclobacteriaceae bacterium]|nr:response regulator [Cyclobacteriaceae bacterium]
MKKILLIEDNTEVRENTAEILSLANYEVTTAKNGREGAELAQRLLPDLVVCDIMMPELDGYGVLHILSKKPETARIPFIFLTAKAEKADMRKGMSLGADDYLTKPFDDTDLLNAIEVRLRKNEMRLHNYEATEDGLNKFIQDARQILNLKNLCEGNKVKSFKKRSEIFSEGDTPSYVYFVKSGNVKTYKSHPDGKEFITNLYKGNDFFGYEPVLENANFTDSAIALEDSDLVMIPKNDFITLLHNQQDVSISFISLLCKKVSEKEAQLLHLAYNSVRQRTADALLKMWQLKSGTEPLSLLRDDLAKMVGTAPESVIRVLSDFRDEGLIEMDGTKIKLMSSNKLQQVVRWNVARK